MAFVEHLSLTRNMVIVILSAAVAEHSERAKGYVRVQAKYGFSLDFSFFSNFIHVRN